MEEEDSKIFFNFPEIIESVHLHRETYAYQRIFSVMHLATIASGQA